MAPPSSRDRLDHLTGVRCLMALWIVCGHYMPNSAGVFEAFMCRSFAAVDVFIVMSGFVTHWAYSDRLARRAWSKSQFYVKRLAPIMLTTYVAMLVSLAVCLAFREPWLPDAWQITRCFFMVEHWLQPAAWCPAPPSWTVEALLPCWLLYPWIRRASEALEARHGSLALTCAAAGLWALSFGPALGLYIANGGYFRWRWHAMFFFFPPAQLPDFAMGVFVAALARHHAQKGQAPEAACRETRTSAEGDGSPVSHPLARACLADLSAIVPGVVLLLLPSDSSKCQHGRDLLFDHMFAPAIATFLFCTAVAGTGNKGIVAWLLSHQPFVALGGYSFEVYLFQWPLVDIVRHLFGTTLSAPVFAAYLFALWLLAGVYAEWLAPPMLRILLPPSEERLPSQGSAHDDDGGATPEALERAPLAVCG